MPHQAKNWRESQRQYLWLKGQYKKQERYQEEDDAHWWASYCETKADHSVLSKMFRKIMYECILGYGVKPGRIFMVIFSVIFCCAGVFAYGVSQGKVTSISLNAPISSTQPTTQSANIESVKMPFESNNKYKHYLYNGLYFSVITFATVGYGDIHAVGWAASLAMIEGLLGVILNAALIVVIFRKMVR